MPDSSWAGCTAAAVIWARGLPWCLLKFFRETWGQGWQLCLNVQMYCGAGSLNGKSTRDREGVCLGGLCAVLLRGVGGGCAKQAKQLIVGAV